MILHRWGIENDVSLTLGTPPYALASYQIAHFAMGPGPWVGVEGIEHSLIWLAIIFAIEKIGNPVLRAAYYAVHTKRNHCLEMVYRTTGYVNGKLTIERGKFIPMMLVLWGFESLIRRSHNTVWTILNWSSVYSQLLSSLNCWEQSVSKKIKKELQGSTSGKLRVAREQGHSKKQNSQIFEVNELVFKKNHIKRSDYRLSRRPRKLVCQFLINPILRILRWM